MNYPLDKYKFITAGNRVIAITTYAGKRVRGVAVCSKDDNFSLEKGKELAAARCALKVAQKRYKRASRKLGEAENACANADSYYDRMICYYEDSFNEVDEARYNLENLLESL